MALEMLANTEGQRRAVRHRAQQLYQEVNLHPLQWEQRYDKAVSDSDIVLRKYKEAMRALELLTPGGSEYVGDIDRCVAHVRDARESMMAAMIMFKQRKDMAETQLSSAVVELNQQLSAAREEISRLLVENNRLNEQLTQEMEAE